MSTITLSRANTCEHSENTECALYECPNDAVGTCIFCGIDICEFCVKNGYCYVGSHHALKPESGEGV